MTITGIAGRGHCLTAYMTATQRSSFAVEQMETKTDLPSQTPFFLLAYDSAECQQVKWAVVSVEWIRFDNEDSGNADGKGGTYPHGAGIDDHTIHYCYYQGK